MATEKVDNFQEEYRKCCTNYNVKVNSIVGKFPTDGSMTELDLSSTLVGSNGVRPILDVVRKCPELRTLNLKGQRLTSEAVGEVVETLKGHPGLTDLNISDNHCPLAGPALLELVRKNTKLLSLKIEDCAIRPMFQKLINMQLEKNGGKPTTAVVEVSVPSESDIIKENSAGGGGAEEAGNGDGDESPFASAWNPSSGGAPSTEIEGGGSDEEFAAFAEGDGGDKIPPKNTSGRDLLRPGSSTRRDKRRPTVCSEVWNDSAIDEFEAPLIAKPEEDAKWLCERLEHVHLFCHLDDRELTMAVGAMQGTKYLMDAMIKTQGAESDDRYHIICSGECDNIVDETAQPMKKGDQFGEVQLLYHQDEPASVKVTSAECLTYSIKRETFRMILAKASKIKRATYGGFLQNIKFLKGMTRTELLQLCDALKTVRLADGECLIQYGEEGQWFHLIVEGQVEVIGRDGDDKNIKVCEFTTGDCVGELEFINNHKCVADVKAVGEVRTAKMNRRHFEMCMGPVVDVLKRVADTSTIYEYYRQNRAVDTDATPEDPPVDAQDDNQFPGITSDDDDGGFGGFSSAPYNLDEPPKPTGRGRRQTVSAEVLTEEDIESFSPNVITKTNEVKDSICAALERMPLFCHLEDFELTTLALAMEEMKYNKDETIIEQGSEGDMFYLVGNGEVIGSSDEEQLEFKSGQNFGEVVLMYSQAYPMSYTASTHDVICYTLDRTTYKHIMQKASMKKRAMYGGFLRKVNFLKTLSGAELLQLADALKPSAYRTGESLINYGDDGTWFYIIVEGTVEVCRFEFFFLIFHEA